MRKKQLPAILFPLLVAVGLLSLPFSFNKEIRNALAQRALTLSRLFQTGAKKCPSQPSLEGWLHDRAIKVEHAAFQAQTFCPFSICPQEAASSYIVAQVVFRTPNRWNSSFWINKGSLDSPLIQKNSPVLSCDSLVGVIDYVGKKASSVRLITDFRLSTSVRVARGAPDPELAAALQHVKMALDDGTFASLTGDEKKALLWLIDRLQQEQNLPKKPEFLAKGILQGSGGALWKQETSLLKGTGFNYDFKDQHGPSRDLRTGEIIDPLHEYPQTAPTALVQVGDLLVTSGMDGIFPEGLKVAKVHSIQPLTEGAFAYDLFAAPTALDIANLDFVTILPPQDFDSTNLPTQVDLIIDQLE